MADIRYWKSFRIRIYVLRDWIEIIYVLVQFVLCF